MGLSFTIAAGPRQRSHPLSLPFSSPPATRSATVEVFDPASTREPYFQRCHQHFRVELEWRWISVLHLVGLQQTQIRLFRLVFSSESFRHLMVKRFPSTQEKQYRRRISGQNSSHLLTCPTDFSPTASVLLVLYFCNVRLQFYSTEHCSSWITFS
jgi:hypothetical protein